MSGPWQPFKSRLPARISVCFLLALAIAGCGSSSAGSPPAGAAGSPESSEDAAGGRLHEQAQAALGRWAEAVGHAKEQGAVFVGELTGQIGDWEESVGENNKTALMSGQIQTTGSIATQTPPPGEVQWASGETTTVELLSAEQALDEMIKSAGSTCSDCRPIEITGARFTNGAVQTSRGPATAPIWEFSLQGTNVKVTRVAVSGHVSVVPPPWDPNNAPEGISIESARGTADASQFTVSFVGAPDEADQPCGADYTAEAVESPLAAVVIVVEHRNPTATACRAIGAARTAVVDLAVPLGDRVLLEVKEGFPVPLLAP
jgi:hypothetical protein